MKYKRTEILSGMEKYEPVYDRQWLFYIAIASFILWTGIVIGWHTAPKPVISPLPEFQYIPAPTETPTPTPTVAPRQSVKGTASYYSAAGCLGCDPNLVMANGETFSDNRLTIALTPETVRAHKLLNDEVRVRNVNNGQEVLAKVTDTGGFAKYNRVADLGVAVKEAINCTSLCEVEIYW